MKQVDIDKPSTDNTQSALSKGDKWKGIGFILIIVGMSIVMAGAPITGGGLGMLGISVFLIGRFMHRKP